jgi:hypothetical protein
LLSDFTSLREGSVLLSHNKLMIINNRYLIIFNIGSINHRGLNSINIRMWQARHGRC